MAGAAGASAATTSTAADWPCKKVNAAFRFALINQSIDRLTDSSARRALHTHNTPPQVTLIRPLVGRVRTPSFPLPGPAYVYGARVQKDNESAATRTYVYLD